MRVLVVGGGGREHALVWKISKSPYSENIYCAPGNAGISRTAECLDIAAVDIKGLIHFAERNAIDLTVVGPEQPLVEGIVDQFQKRQLPIFGPCQAAAKIEGSKAFARELMTKFRIPSPAYRVFTNPNEAAEFVKKKEPPFVLKADGLAEGKGVLVCPNRTAAFGGIEAIMKKKTFGEAGKKLVIEEYLSGEEVSVLAITDGEKIVILPSAQDHKPIFEGDTGPNTGGMGAYSPAPLIKPSQMDSIRAEVFAPLIHGMGEMGIPYRGVLYAGLMITPAGPKVLEFNCRFGDPEIQAILPLLQTDILDLMMESAEGRLKNEQVQISKQSAVCVVMASGGYPGSYEKGKVIRGLQSIPHDILVFHAGTKSKDGDLMTAGGRVLGVTALGDTISQAIESAYRAVGKITFDGAYFRRDIGHKALVR